MGFFYLLEAVVYLNSDFMVARGKYWFIIFILIISSGTLLSQQTVVDNLEQLTNYETNNSTVVFVSDAESGGLFYISKANIQPDYGIVFPRKNGGIWVRHFNKALGVNIAWWGAKGDGYSDDIEAFNRATKYCLDHNLILNLPSGVFRISKQWVIGAKATNEATLLNNGYSISGTINIKAHEMARSLSPFIVRGSTNTCIYGDFDTDSLTAIVYYGIKSNGLPKQKSNAHYTHEFSNIGFYGKGFFDGIKPKIQIAKKKSNKQIGLALVYGTNIKITGCTFNSLEYGMVANTIYFSSITNSHFENCFTGIHTLFSNSNLIQNVSGFYNKVFINIRGSQIVINNLNSEYCETALIFSGINLVLNGVYCENHNLNLPNNSQLIFGRSDGNSKSSKSLTTGVVINGMTLTAGGRDVIMLSDDMRTLNINGSNINGKIITRNKASKIILSNTIGGLNVIGPAQIIDQR